MKKVASFAALARGRDPAMNRLTEGPMSDGADTTGDGTRALRLAIGGGLLTAASVAVPTLFPLAFPDLTASTAISLFIGSGLVLLGGGLVLFWGAWRSRPKTAPQKVARRWALIGLGQGWIEIRIRNNSGAQFVVSANPGSGADKISFDLTFSGPRRPRRTEVVELLLEVDREPFELDIPDAGELGFAVHAALWRDVELLRQITAAFRRGSDLRASIPALGLTAVFTLEGAFDALQEVEALGQVEEAGGVNG